MRVAGAANEMATIAATNDLEWRLGRLEKRIESNAATITAVTSTASVAIEFPRGFRALRNRPFGQDAVTTTNDDSIRFYRKTSHAINLDSPCPLFRGELVRWETVDGFGFQPKPKVSL